jgi:chlorophyllide a oxygenase
VSSALDKLAQMETVVNERLLSDGSAFAATADCASLDPSTSFTPRVGPKKTKRRSLNISGPVKPYNSNLKNFWYPVAFSSDLKDDTMVNKMFSSKRTIVSRHMVLFDKIICVIISGTNRLF